MMLMSEGEATLPATVIATGGIPGARHGRVNSCPPTILARPGAGT
jgi:hypothetical protein